MLQRLIGIETEYATLVRSPIDQQRPPSRRQVYEAICARIGKAVPTAQGRYDADTIFLANGGAFSMESDPTRSDQPGGLIEGATAETRSPSRLVECQRAQDRLIAEAAETCAIPGEVRVFKNGCDAHGHIYGCQENYSAPVASGFWLGVYWFLMAMVLPFAMVYWAVCISVLAIELGCMVVVRLPAVGWSWLKERRDALNQIVPGRPADRRSATSAAEASGPRNALLNNDAGRPAESVPSDSLAGSRLDAERLESPSDVTSPAATRLPERLLSWTASGLRLVNLPTAVMLYFIARKVAFRRQRKYLTAFLISRVVVTGSGHVDRQNRYRLSSKAMAIDSVVGFGGYLSERPIYVFHHWLQQLCGRSLLSVRSVTEMFRRQQRLQIGLSDSNVSDTAEFLKVGTTALVLDMIEAGGGRELPRLLKPIDALHRIAGDWDLVARVATTRGEMSGLDLQRHYLRACQRFVVSQDVPADHEAHTVLQRWEEVLEALAAFRSAEMDPRPALGHVDWLTKKWMLDRLDEKNPGLPAAGGSEQPVAVRRAQRWTARKKVDIRYHELSRDGYFARLRCVSPEVCSVDPAGIDAALRMPPTSSPALRRGQLIREFAGGTETVAVDWSHVVIGTGRHRKVVTLG